MTCLVAFSETVKFQIEKRQYRNPKRGGIMSVYSWERLPAAITFLIDFVPQLLKRINRNDRHIGSLLNLLPPVNETASPRNRVAKNFAEVPQAFEIISGDGHAAFNFDGEKIRSVDQQQIDLIALAVSIKIKV